jgi:hypothetical protein
MNKNKLRHRAAPRLPSRCSSNSANAGGTIMTPNQAAPPRQPSRTWDEAEAEADVVCAIEDEENST